MSHVILIFLGEMIAPVCFLNHFHAHEFCCLQSVPFLLPEVCVCENVTACDPDRASEICVTLVVFSAGILRRGGEHSGSTRLVSLRAMFPHPATWARTKQHNTQSYFHILSRCTKVEQHAYLEQDTSVRLKRKIKIFLCDPNKVSQCLPTSLNRLYSADEFWLLIGQKVLISHPNL